MSAPLHIQLLGDFRLMQGDDVLTSVHTERLQALLAYLAIHTGTPQLRRRIAFSFWPDSREKQAMGNLRNLLFRLREALPDADRFLEGDANSLCWKKDSTRVDVVEFEWRLARAGDYLQEGNTDAALNSLQEAVRFYRGELLPGRYDEWIFPERERLHQEAVRAHEQLIELLENRRDYAGALLHGRRLLQLEPLREPTFRLLMRLHALNDDRASALRVFDRCRERLKADVDLEPEEATLVLYQRILKADDPDRKLAGDDARTSTLLPLVGRNDEWNRLRAAWRRLATERRAHGVAVLGEAGIGKTRLAQELFEWCGRQGFDAVRARCYAAEGRLAYAPIVEWMRSPALQHRLSGLDHVWREELALLLPELRAARPDRAPSQITGGDGTRQRLFEALARAVLAGGEPILLLLDDVQWCDGDTLEWLRFLMHFAEEAPVLVLCTVRIEEMGADHPVRGFILDLAHREQFTRIELEPLDPEKTAELAEFVREAPVDDAERDALFRETEGNPLFVVESIRAGIRLDERPEIVPGLPMPVTRPLPAKVHAVIAKRLGLLSPVARSVVHVAAVIGRSFSFDLLSETSHLSEEELLDAVDELWGSYVVREYDDETYDFTHDKLREIAYNEITPVRRRLLHRRVAEALAAIRGSDENSFDAQVAAHYDLAGLRHEAVAAFRRAAQATERIGSHRQTVQLLQRALALLEADAESARRHATMLDVLMALGLATRLVDGHASESVKEVFERAGELCNRIGTATDRFTVQRGLWSFHLLSGRYDAAGELAEELGRLADQIGDDSFRMEALVALGLTFLWRGTLDAAVDVLEKGLTLYDRSRHRAHVEQFGQDPGVACHSLLAYASWYLGRGDRAVGHMAEALSLAESLGHPFSRAYALQHAMLLEHGRRRPKSTLSYANTLLKISEEREFAYWMGPAMIGKGWAMAMLDQPDRGIALMRRGIDVHHKQGARLSSTLWLGMLADALIRAGRSDEALEHVERALAMAHRSGERIWESELKRMKDELSLTNAK